MVKIYRNGTQITNFIINAPYSDTIDEELDKTNFQLKSTTRLSFTKNDKIQYQVSQTINDVETIVINKTFCLFDYVESLEGGFWLYQLTCLSPTKLLENIIINGMAETHSNWTLRQQLDRTILKINKQLICETSFPIELELTTDPTSDLYLLSLKAGNDFLWSGQQTAREILQDICDKADMLIVATDFQVYANSQFNIKKITLDVVKREKSGTKLIETNSSIEGGGLNAYEEIIKGLSIHRNSEFNNGSIISLTKNAICKDNVQQTYMPARNTDLTIDNEADWHIITQEPIYSLNNVKVLVNVKNVAMSVLNPDQTIKYSISPLTMTAELDITNYIVEKEVFDVMPLSEQKKHLYFVRGECGIFGLYNRYKSGITGYFTNTAIENILDDLSDNFPSVPLTRGNFASIVNDAYWGSFSSDYKTFTKAVDMTEITLNNEYVNYGGQLSDIVPSNFTYGKPNAYADYSDKILFSINYQPYCDSVVKIGKGESINARAYNLSVLKNQSDRTIDASKYYDSQRALIKRLGNDEMTLDCEFKDTKLWGLGDFMLIQSSKWTLTKREIENYGNEFIKARLTFSNKYNASNSAINVNRDKRLYGIPLNQYVDRYLLINVDTAYNYTKLLVYSYDDFTEPHADSDTTIGYTILDLIRIGNDEIIDKVARCKDNYAVDIERTKYSSTIVNVNLRYCMTNGEMEDIRLKLLTDSQYNQLTISDYSRLPFLPTTSINVGLDKTLDDIHKDKMERLVFVIKGYNPN